MKQDIIISWIRSKHGWKISKTEKGFTYNLLPISKEKLFWKLHFKVKDRFMLTGTSEEDYGNDSIHYYLNNL
ncbi:MAG: hypothetical protein SLAVMIC_01045 [uncultured marine phage]|uniref:Uncharacterized protein n=1 Tax=uncultured marine phage TaxID=707152 RepID=A0A8D9C9Y0_9VIRU|nr:MAG: hypothetical protein SLAVMIC_01045 [uncultured marine phage]